MCFGGANLRKFKNIFMSFSRQKLPCNQSSYKNNHNFINNKIKSRFTYLPIFLTYHGNKWFNFLQFILFEKTASFVIEMKSFHQCPKSLLDIILDTNWLEEKTTHSLMKRAIKCHISNEVVSFQRFKNHLRVMVELVTCCVANLFVSVAM